MAAQRPGLTQALAGARSGFTRLSSRVKSHDSPASRSPGKNQRPVARAACRPGPSARMGRLWLQPHKEHIKAGHPANISFKPSPLRGLGHTGPQRAGRLNSGVRPQKTDIKETSFSIFVLESRPLIYENSLARGSGITRAVMPPPGCGFTRIKPILCLGR